MGNSGFLKKLIKSDSFLKTGRLINKPYKDVSISFIIMCKDEERCISRCLNSILDAASEIIVIDTGSKDNTISIISEYDDVKLFRHEWNDDFSGVRNFGITKATSDWVFFIDADEWLLDCDEHLLPLLSYLNTFKLANESTFSPKIKNDEAQITWSNGRIFKKNSNIRYRGRVHEEPILESGDLPYNIPIDISIGHDGYIESVLILKNKLDRNLSLLEKSLVDEPDDVRWRFFLLRDKFTQDNISEMDSIKSDMIKLMDDIYSSERELFAVGYFRELYKYIMMIMYSQKEFSKMKEISLKYSDVLNDTSDYFYYKSIYEIEMLRESYIGEVYKRLDLAVIERENFDSSDNYSLSPDGYHIDEVIYLCLNQLGHKELCEKYMFNIRENYPNRMIIP